MKTESFNSKPLARVDIVHVSGLSTALLLYGQKIQSAGPFDAKKLEEIRSLAGAMEKQLGLEVVNSRIHMPISATWDDVLSTHSRIESDKPVASDYELQALDRHINTEILDELAGGLKGALTRSINRIASLKDEFIAKYHTSGLTTASGLLTITGALNDNPLLYSVLPELTAATAGAALMTTYGATALVAAKAHQYMVRNCEPYQDKVNDRILGKLTSLMEKHCVHSADSIPAKEKAQLLQTLRLSYPEANADTLAAFEQLHTLRLHPENIESKTNDMDKTTNAPGMVNR